MKTRLLNWTPRSIPAHPLTIANPPLPCYKHRKNQDITFCFPGNGLAPEPILQFVKGAMQCGVNGYGFSRLSRRSRFRSRSPARPPRLKRSSSPSRWTGLSFFPIYVGRIKGFFKEEGLTLDVKATAGGGPHLTAVLAGKAEFTASPGTYQLNALNSGKRAIGFVDLLRRNIIGMVIHKDAAKKAGIKDGMPLMEKVKRAKGLKVGVTRPGALTDVLARNLLGRAMMKVPADVRILAVGGGGTMLPAFKNPQDRHLHHLHAAPRTHALPGSRHLVRELGGRRGQGHQGIHDDGRHGHAQAHEGAPPPRQADGARGHEVPEIHPENVHSSSSPRT